MNTKLLATTALIAGFAFTGSAVADMTKTITTTTTKVGAGVAAETPVLSADTKANITSDTTITKKSGYYGYDTNGNGFLDPDEYTSYSYNIIDINGDKFVTDQEWDTYTKVIYKPTIEMHTAEMAAAEAKVEAENRATQADVKAAEFAILDANADGRIDLDEYAKAKTRTTVFSSWDADSNGYVDDTEYKTIVTTYKEVDTDGVYSWN